MLFCKAHVLSERYFWVQSAKMVSVDIAFSCEATVSFGCSFSSDILLIFQGLGYGLFRNPKIPPILQKKRTKNNLFNRTEDS